MVEPRAILPAGVGSGAAAPDTDADGAGPSPGPVVATNPQTRVLMSELKGDLSRIYGAALRGVYLYGSFARAGQGPESDLDVLIVLDRVASYSAEIDRTSEAIARLSLRHAISVSRVFVSERDWRDARTVFLAGVREEAVAA